MSCIHAFPSFLVHWYVLLCILSYKFVVSFSTCSIFVCTSILRQFFCFLPPVHPRRQWWNRSLQMCLTVELLSFFETGLPACHRAGLTVLQRFFLVFVAGL